MVRPLTIIPTYNERDNLEELVQSIASALPAGDLLIVDDHSPDGTGQLADALAGGSPRVKVLHRSTKEGLGKAYTAGFRWALTHNYDPICTMDADFSHDPNELPALTQAVFAEADVAVGSRYVTGGKIIGWSRGRHYLSGAANSLAKIFLRLKPHDVTAGYKCYRRSFLATLDFDAIVSSGYAFQVEMLLTAQDQGKKIVELPIIFHDRRAGQSKVSRHELLSSSKSFFKLVIGRPAYRQFVKYGLVGWLNFFIDIGLTNILVLLFHWPETWAGYVGIAGTLMNSFIVNRQWTFRAKRGNLRAQAVRFLVVNGIGGLINAVFYTLFLVYFELYYNFAKILAGVVGAVWNFSGMKIWVFHPAREEHR